MALSAPGVLKEKAAGTLPVFRNFTSLTTGIRYLLD